MKLALNKATLIKRYKRFLADIHIDQQPPFTIHCANTGAMTGCAEPDSTVWFSTSDNKKRKYPHSWEITETQTGDFICVNTIRANQLAEEALSSNAIEAFQDIRTLKREVPFGEENSKVDFCIEDKDGHTVFIEVKSVTLLREGQGYFPDAVTTRGQKHLRELTQLAQSGQKAVLLFAVLHSGINSVQAAADIDPTYAKLLKQAAEAGVVILAYKAKFTLSATEASISLEQPLAVKW